MILTSAPRSARFLLDKPPPASERRNAAVHKGMTWMARFFTRDKHKRLYAVGDDAPSIFFELWYTTADSKIRVRAKAIALDLSAKLEKRLLKDAKGLGKKQPPPYCVTSITGGSTL